MNKESGKDRLPDGLVVLVSTFFYVGYLPVAPGSMASVVGAGLAFLLAGNTAIYLLVTALITWLGFSFSGGMERISRKKDPGCVVIDEVSGILISFFLLPWRLDVFWATFFLFRAFDMFKIYPANRFEKLHGSTGIMMDDVVAGIYTNLTMQIAVRLAGLV